MSRERDYAYEALAETTGTDMTAGRGELNVALKSIRDQSEIDDSYLLADEIHVRSKLYRLVMPDVLLTPTALAKHWLRVFEEANRKPAVASNQSAAVSPCETCGGDWWVLVGHREDGHEEWAPCPDCGTKIDASFWRQHNGTRFTPPDPARVRQMMSQ